MVDITNTRFGMGERSERQLLVGLEQLLTGNNQLLVEMLAELKHIRSALASTSQSSVELSENAKGTVQITVKTYVDSAPVDNACAEAVAAFATLKQEVERGQIRQWSDTVDALKAAADDWKTIHKV